MNYRIDLDFWEEPLGERELELIELRRQLENLQVYERTPGANLKLPEYLDAKESLFNQIKIYGGNQNE